MKKIVVILMSIVIIGVTCAYAIQIVNGDETESIATFNAFALNLVSPSEDTGSWHTLVDWFSRLANNWAGLEASHLASNNPSAAPAPETAVMILLGTGLVGITGFGRKILKKNLPVECSNTPAGRPTALGPDRIDDLHTCRLQCC